MDPDEVSEKPQPTYNDPSYWVVVRCASHCVELAFKRTSESQLLTDRDPILTKVILIRIIRPMPSDHVEDASSVLSRVQETIVLAHYRCLLVRVDIAGFWYLKVSNVCQTNSPDGSQLRQIIVSGIALYGKPAHWAIRQRNVEANSSWNNAELRWSDTQVAHLRLDVERTFLGD